MKKITFLLLMVFATLAMQARDINPENVPAGIKGYVTKHYPKASYIKWEDKTKKGYYQAEFVIDGREYKLDISTNGTLIRSKEDMMIKDIPSFATNYIKKNYDQPEILGANKRYENGSTSYSVGIRFKGYGGYDRNRNVVFDSNGNVLRR